MKLMSTVSSTNSTLRHTIRHTTTRINCPTELGAAAMTAVLAVALPVAPTLPSQHRPDRKPHLITPLPLYTSPAMVAAARARTMQIDRSSTRLHWAET